MSAAIGGSAQRWGWFPEFCFRNCSGGTDAQEDDRRSYKLERHAERNWSTIAARCVEQSAQLTRSKGIGDLYYDEHEGRHHAECGGKIFVLNDQCRQNNHVPHTEAEHSTRRIDAARRAASYWRSSRLDGADKVEHRASIVHTLPGCGPSRLSSSFRAEQSLRIPHQRSTRLPTAAPASATRAMAGTYQATTNSGESSGQWVA
jgi:hypothetical protein